jgi:ABC-type transport system involved in multi-copper enzyme maturation permease subunit
MVENNNLDEISTICSEDIYPSSEGYKCYFYKWFCVIFLSVFITCFSIGLMPLLGSLIEDNIKNIFVSGLLSLTMIITLMSCCLFCITGCYKTIDETYQLHRPKISKQSIINENSTSINISYNNDIKSTIINQNSTLFNNTKEESYETKIDITDKCNICLELLIISDITLKHCSFGGNHKIHTECLKSWEKLHPNNKCFICK